MYDPAVSFIAYIVIMFNRLWENVSHLVDVLFSEQVRLDAGDVYLVMSPLAEERLYDTILSDDVENSD
jgi:hypothetical protein